MSITSEKIIYYPDKKAVESAISTNEPILLLVSFDSKEILVAVADTVVEHTIMLRKLGHSELDIDKYFRVVANHSGADWTFVCPQDYKNIKDKMIRIKKFYNDGFDIIAKALKKIGCDVPIEIPVRYRRHINLLRNNNGFH